MLVTLSTQALQLLFLLTLLPLQPKNTQAYPITSKPIEWTAENLAWQPWAWQTSEEQSKGKARKVTPKSIFDIPYRADCPKGHHLDGHRCIQTVKIDQNELRDQQLLALIDDANVTIDPTIDYEEEGVSAFSDGIGIETTINIYNGPQMFSGNIPLNFDSGTQLPSEDAPLKFNFFEQTLSGNENDTMRVGTGDEEDYTSVDHDNKNLVSVSANKTSFEVVDKFSSANVNNTLNNSNSTNSFNKTIILIGGTTTTDLLTESTNISANVIGKTLEDNNSKLFLMGNIDALSLPAHHHQENDDSKTMPTRGKVSLYKDDSAVHLITSSTFEESKQLDTQSHTQAELMNFPKGDAWVPLDDEEQVEMLSTTTVLSADGKDMENSDQLLEVSSMTLQDKAEEDGWETTESTVSHETHKFIIMPLEESRKTDHTRSVANSDLLSAELLSAQEDDFTTTLEPDATTSFQLDDTTIIEAVHPPTIELQELQVQPAQHSQEQKQESQEPHQPQGVHEKSKVEPVSFNPTNAELLLSVDILAMSTTTTPLPTVPTTTLLAGGNWQQQYQSEIITDGFDVDYIADADAENQFDYQQKQSNNTNQGAKQLGAVEVSSNLAESVMEATAKATNTMLYVKGTMKSPTIELTAITTTTENSAETKGISNIGIETTMIPTKADMEKDFQDVKADEVIFVVSNAKPKVWSPENNNTETAIITTTETTTTTMTPDTTTMAAASKRWSKVMPIFNQNPVATEKLLDIIEDSTKAAKKQQIYRTTKSSSPSSLIINKRQSNRRNSKIIRMDKYPLAVSVNSLSESITTIPTTTADLMSTTTDDTTTISNTFKSEKSSSTSTSNSDPFWWLPLGWHLDRHEDVEGSPLLSRLWTTFTSNNEAKV